MDDYCNSMCVHGEVFLPLSAFGKLLCWWCLASKSRRSSSGSSYEKDEKLTEKEKELMEKDAEVGGHITLFYCVMSFTMLMLIHSFIHFVSQNTA